jgi:thiosulfate/3-mercaptopyruvate sulfurtransferase
MSKLLLLLLLGAAGLEDSKISSEKLAERMKTAQPLVIHIGFNVLYRSAHIANTVYAGPGSKPEGLEDLKKLVAGEPKDREIVIYCGCCPWEKCPNIRPAFAALREMGFTKLSALYIPETLAKDWIDKGLPTDKRAAQ